MAIDPICGMTVEPATAAGRHDYQGTTYFFCSLHCLNSFRADPAKHLHKAPLMMAMPSGKKPLPMVSGGNTDDALGEIDPVCGMTVQPATAAGSHIHQGKTYHFCSRACLDKFRADPQRYLAPAESEHSRPTPTPLAANYICPMCPEIQQTQPGPCPKCGMALEPTSLPSLATKTEYVCPMHPEIVTREPGACPICGMALEARTVVAEEATPELLSMTRRFWFALGPTAVVLFLAMSEMLP
ncbi:MAG: YHS domain-containing protein, partial [Nitrospiraceae bacterium]